MDKKTISMLVKMESPTDIKRELHLQIGVTIINGIKRIQTVLIIYGKLFSINYKTNI